MLFGGNLYFNYAGKSSREYGLVIVSTKGGLFEDSFFPQRSTNKQKPMGRTKSMLQSVTLEDLTFGVELAFIESFKEINLEEVATWLFQDYYSPFYLEKEDGSPQTDAMVHAMFVDSSNVFHNGMREGYLSLTLETNSPFVYSLAEVTAKQNVASSYTYTFNNDSASELFPEISILTKAAGDIRLTTIVNGKTHNIFEIKNLTNNEDLYLDCYREIIETDQIGLYRYGNIIGHFPSLPKGVSQLKVEGKCECQLRYQKEYIYKDVLK